MLNIKVNEGKSITLRNEKGQWLLNDTPVTTDVVKLGPNRYHVLFNNQSITIELLRKDETGKQLDLVVNGIRQQVVVQDEFDALLHKLGMDKLMTNKVNDIKAPMPGLVLSIKVKEGDVIRKGDPLLVLEAMKMENVLKAPADAVVKKISINERTAVEKNQVLLVME